MPIWAFWQSETRAPGVAGSEVRAVDSRYEAEGMTESREVMNIKEASDYLGVSPDTLYKYVYEEKIPAFKLGNRWKFKKSKLDQWMDEKSTVRDERSKKKPKPAHFVAGGR
jgi:excisionase family DNA binding protein